MGNFITDRSSSRVLAPPGGVSSLSLAYDEVPKPASRQQQYMGTPSGYGMSQQQQYAPPAQDNSVALPFARSGSGSGAYGQPSSGYNQSQGYAQPASYGQSQPSYGQQQSYGQGMQGYGSSGNAYNASGSPYAPSSGYSGSVGGAYNSPGNAYNAQPQSSSGYKYGGIPSGKLLANASFEYLGCMLYLGSLYMCCLCKCMVQDTMSCCMFAKAVLV